jgi:hypothetical protein
MHDEVVVFRGGRMSYWRGRGKSRGRCMNTEERSKSERYVPRNCEISEEYHQAWRIDLSVVSPVPSTRLRHTGLNRRRHGRISRGGDQSWVVWPRVKICRPVAIRVATMTHCHLLTYLVIFLRVSFIVTCLLPLAIRLAVDTDCQHGYINSVYQTQ